MAINWFIFFQLIIYLLISKNTNVVIKYGHQKMKKKHKNNGKYISIWWIAWNSMTFISSDYFIHFFQAYPFHFIKTNDFFPKSIKH